MSTQTMLITDHDRRRLGTMLDRAYAEAIDPWNRLHRLEMDLDHAVGIDGSDLPADMVTMNSVVRIVDLDSGEDETYTLVYPDHADITEDKISVLAPIGQAILGRKAGETVAVAVPSGERWFKIEAVHFQPERSGQRHP